MVYEIFLQAVSRAMQEQLGNSYSISIHKVHKNNGILLDGLCVSRGPNTVTPTIYLNSYYEQFLDGRPLQDIFIDIQQLYWENQDCPTIPIKNFSNFSDVRDRIAWKLIHADSNKELLAQIPHLPFLDLAIVFYLYLDRSAHGQMTTLIYNEHLKPWGVTMEGLKRLATRNTPRLFPVSINSMRMVMKGIVEDNLAHALQGNILENQAAPNKQDELYILSNTVGLNGASCLLYKETLSQFADWIGCDFAILPSSVHEVLLLPDPGSVSYPKLEQMVLRINRAEVPVADRLSNQIYRYSRNTQQISVASHGTETLNG